ncbi:GlxA family transcriptional regulator [Crenothrix polyspora]|uniref:Transcriptional regulator containing an amidase domain and an AraC-type DNA-binding HTH domain n=1 Tax=Crenothrix polyspora TaxID=360316 RepID=A0A1R4H7G2_9GAMM|nr:GlxA family transcriptional regulator [Crenothrix polyspora]SJM92192.1 Transcriptional regulator containing an amidase domain and an AraC-type DNA-binding HTH domain [Crenothrix polyspora]
MKSVILPKIMADATQKNDVKPKTVAIVVYPGVEIIDVTGPMEVFAFANYGLQQSGQMQQPAYTLQVIAAKQGALISSCGLQIIADKSYNDIHDGIDTLLIAGATNIDCLLCDPELQAWVKAIAPNVRRMASVCTGAFLLAETGLLNGLKATSHWLFCKRLATDYPAVKVEPDRIFVRDGAISTSGGITSGIDLALSMVEEDWGSELSLTIARTLVVFLRRSGGQSQFSAYLTGEAHRPEVRDLQAWVMSNLRSDLRVETLAERMCMSPRNFARFFVTETGITPAKFVELARIDAARHYLGSSHLSVEVIADKAGFGDAERMRRAFVRQLGVNPQNYRSRFSGSETHFVEV